MAGGRLLAFSLARYLRTWPPDAGNAALTETVAVPDGLDRRVERLMAALGWEGIFELELVRGDDGSFASIDLNPRPYGSIALAIGAGADLPAVWAAWLLGRESPYAVARPGVTYRWEDAELRRVVWELRHGSLAGAAQVARPHRRVVYPHFQWSDPGPLLARGAYFAGRALSRARKGPGQGGR
jgi:predicted ATP-grasp superfamily ATP-dependent carboligase